MHGHRTPSAAHVKEPHARPLIESEFSAHQIVLGHLGPLEGGRRLGEIRTRVRHRRTKDQLVEVVADVVVMSDGVSVTLFGMSEPARQHFLNRSGDGETDRTDPLRGT